MVARMDGRADSVPAQKTGKGRLLGRSDRCLRPGAGDAPRMGHRHRATHTGGVRRPPLYLELTRTHVLCHMEGLGGSSPGTQFCCKSSSFFFRNVPCYYFFNFLFCIGV